MSYLEIYNENIRDLLNTGSGHLELRDDSKGRNIQVAGLSEVATKSTEEVKLSFLIYWTFSFMETHSKWTPPQLNDSQLSLRAFGFGDFLDILLFYLIFASLKCWSTFMVVIDDCSLILKNMWNILSISYLQWKSNLSYCLWTILVRYLKHSSNALHFA